MGKDQPGYPGATASPTAEKSSSQCGHIVDSQSVKSSGVGAEKRGYDGGKKVKGPKRHLLVDTEGFVLKAKVHSAKVMDYVRGSKRYLSGLGSSSCAFRICGWTLATGERTKARTGWRRL